MKDKIYKITHFTQLKAWQENHKAVLEIYKITKKFPKEEIFGLTNQLRRAGSSITGNIAEGTGRFHYKDRLKFYYNARGSNTEVQSYLIISKDLSYITNEEYLQLIKQVYESYKILCGLINKTVETLGNEKIKE